LQFSCVIAALSKKIVQRQLASVQITLAYFSQEQIAYIMAFVVDQHAASQYFKT
jgi:hypothetical protein